jgi:hypothetical protein
MAQIQDLKNFVGEGSRYSVQHRILAGEGSRYSVQRRILEQVVLVRSNLINCTFHTI